jgi:hypothetical protein
MFPGAPAHENQPIRVEHYMWKSGRPYADRKQPEVQSSEQKCLSSVGRPETLISWRCEPDSKRRR